MYNDKEYIFIIKSFLKLLKNKLLNNNKISSEFKSGYYCNLDNMTKFLLTLPKKYNNYKKKYEN